MESSTPTLINKKWMLCTFASFLGFFFLVLCLNQGARSQRAVLASLQALATNTSEGVAVEFPISSVVLSSQTEIEVSSQASHIELLPQTGVVVEEGVKSQFKIALSPQSSIVLNIAPPPPSNKELSPQSDVVDVVTSQLSLEMSQQYEEKGSSVSVSDGIDEKTNDSTEEARCDIYDGRWVYDPKDYPLYRVTQCPFLSDQVSCRKNGRPDSDYEHWRWEPRDCEIPRFNGTEMLERLRGKRVVIVGDSLNRNQWESLSCLLYSSIHPSRAIVKARGSEYKIFKALDYDCSVEFYWSPFLVKMEEMEGGKRVLKLDKLPGSAKRWRGAHVMVFNTGHWWTHRGKMRAWDYFARRGELMEEMEGDTAFETALKTWARWIDRKVDPTKTTVFFRSVSPEHKVENGHWCYNQTYPIRNETYVQWFPKSMISIAERTIQEMRTPVKYLNITRLSEYRREAHTAVYTVKQGKLLTKDQRNQPQTYADCSHWCLPGLPDTWNLLLYASIDEEAATIVS